MGARDVLANWAGWLMVSASKATSCSVRASSKMRSVSLWTSAAGAGRRRGSGGWHGGDGRAHGGCGGDCQEMRRGERDGDRTRRGLILGLGRSDVTPAPGTGGVRCRREVTVGSQLWHRLGEEGAKPPRTTRIWGEGSDGGCVTGVSPTLRLCPVGRTLLRPRAWSRPGREDGDPRGRAPHCPPPRRAGGCRGSRRVQTTYPRHLYQEQGRKEAARRGENPRERRKRKEKHNREKIKGKEREKDRVKPTGGGGSAGAQVPPTLVTPQRRTPNTSPPRSSAPAQAGQAPRDGRAGGCCQADTDGGLGWWWWGVHAAQPGGGVSMGRPSRGGTLPRLERVLERSMMVCLLGLFKTERLAREMSAVTRVMEILRDGEGTSGWGGEQQWVQRPPCAYPHCPGGQDGTLLLPPSSYPLHKATWSWSPPLKQHEPRGRAEGPCVGLGVPCGIRGPAVGLGVPPMGLGVPLWGEGSPLWDWGSPHGVGGPPTG